MQSYFVKPKELPAFNVQSSYIFLQRLSERALHVFLFTECQRVQCSYAYSLWESAIVNVSALQQERPALQDWECLSSFGQETYPKKFCNYLPFFLRRTGDKAEFSMSHVNAIFLQSQRVLGFARKETVLLLARRSTKELCNPSGKMNLQPY